MNGWMESLGLYYDKVKKRSPKERLIILFDVDGTIIDMRGAIRYVLQSFDRRFHTRFFHDLEISAITIHENRIETLLRRLAVPENWLEGILEWYRSHYWSEEAIVRSHRPYGGVMEVIRWFQAQPGTTVGLNTGRPEALREETLRSLNVLGGRYGVCFQSAHLYMNRSGWNQQVVPNKVEGFRHFRASGFRVFAVVDNEPENLLAIARDDPKREVLLLHADTIYESKRKDLPTHSVSGKVYDLSRLRLVKAMHLCPHAIIAQGD